MDDKAKFESLKQTETALNNGLVKLRTQKEQLDNEIGEMEKSIKTEFNLNSVEDIAEAIKNITSETNSKTQIILENINGFRQVHSQIPEDQKPKFEAVLQTVNDIEAQLQGPQA